MNESRTSVSGTAALKLRERRKKPGATFSSRPPGLDPMVLSKFLPDLTDACIVPVQFLLLCLFFRSAFYRVCPCLALRQRCRFHCRNYQCAPSLLASHLTLGTTYNYPSETELFVPSLTQ